MGIWERLGNVIKSYLSDDDYGADGHNSREQRRNSRGDPDLDAAFEELNDFLGGKEDSGKARDSGKETGSAAGERIRPVPAEIRKDFAELGLSPGASAAECKDAYKKILKMYHPDRHTKNPEAMKEATEKTARINAAYDRLEKWFRMQTPNG